MSGEKSISNKTILGRLQETRQLVEGGRAERNTSPPGDAVTMPLIDESRLDGIDRGRRQAARVEGFIDTRIPDADIVELPIDGIMPPDGRYRRPMPGPDFNSVMERLTWGLSKIEGGEEVFDRIMERNPTDLETLQQVVEEIAEGLDPEFRQELRAMAGIEEPVPTSDEMRAQLEGELADLEGEHAILSKDLAAAESAARDETIEAFDAIRRAQSIEERYRPMIDRAMARAEWFTKAAATHDGSGQSKMLYEQARQSSAYASSLRSLVGAAHRMAQTEQQEAVQARRTMGSIRSALQANEVSQSGIRETIEALDSQPEAPGRLVSAIDKQARGIAENLALQLSTEGVDVDVDDIIDTLGPAYAGLIDDLNGAVQDLLAGPNVDGQPGRSVARAVEAFFDNAQAYLSDNPSELGEMLADKLAARTPLLDDNGEPVLDDEGQPVMAERINQRAYENLVGRAVEAMANDLTQIRGLRPLVSEVLRGVEDLDVSTQLRQAVDEMLQSAMMYAGRGAEAFPAVMAALADVELPPLEPLAMARLEDFRMRLADVFAPVGVLPVEPDGGIGGLDSEAPVLIDGTEPGDEQMTIPDSEDEVR